MANCSPLPNLGRGEQLRRKNHWEKNMPTQANPTTVSQPSDEATGAFRSRLRGELIRPGDATYDEARKVYNAMIDKRPALIARCVDVADVISAVNFAAR